MKQKSAAGIAYVTLIMTFFSWGSAYVSNGYALRYMASTQLAFLRFVVAAVVLGGIIWYRKTPVLFDRDEAGNKKFRLEKCDWKYFAVNSFFGSFICILCILLSVEYSGASMASLINALNPVVITIFAVLFLKERITLRKVICLAVALIGVWIVSSADTSGAQMLGILFGFLSIISWAWASIYMRKLTQKYDPLVVTFLAIMGSLPFHFISALVVTLNQGLPVIQPDSLAAVFYSGIMGTAVPQFLWSFSLSRLEASTCSMFYGLQPVFSALLGVPLLGEQLGTSFFVGGLVIIAAIIISCTGGKKTGTSGT